MNPTNPGSASTPLIDQDSEPDSSQALGAQVRSLLIFEVAAQTCAFAIEPVQQIIEIVTITPIPQTDHLIEGVINVHGKIVPVVNMGAVLGLPATQLLLHTPIILVDTQGHMVGLIVDEVVDILEVAPHEITRPTDILPQGLGEIPFLEGVLRAREAPVLLLDLEYLFTSQRTGLARTLAALSEMDGDYAEETVFSEFTVPEEILFGPDTDTPEAADTSDDLEFSAPSTKLVRRKRSAAGKRRSADLPRARLLSGGKKDGAAEPVDASIGPGDEMPADAEPSTDGRDEQSGEPMAATVE